MSVGDVALVFALLAFLGGCLAVIGFGSVVTYRETPIGTALAGQFKHDIFVAYRQPGA